MSTPTDAALVLPDVRSAVTSPGSQSHTLVNNPKTKVVQFVFEPGRGLAGHTAPFPITIYIARGAATVSIGDAVHEASEGFWAYLPAGLVHAIQAKAATTLLLTLLKDAPQS
ncbi:hypothetical protein F183_A02950 [Bryobacterales bacterium F-183]|nr:hypothetical protein F183_A02950 [Bryobacterales bacterium F-183]